LLHFTFLPRWNFWQIPVVRTSGFREPEEFTDLETVEVTIDSVGITPTPGTTGTGPKSRLCKECPTPAAEASGRILDKLEVGLCTGSRGYSYTVYCHLHSFQVGEFFRLPESCTWSVDGHQSSQYQTTHYQ
jgi:hypothetical protein